MDKDIDQLNALLYDAVRDGVVATGCDRDGDHVVALTEGGFIKARVQATALQLDPDALSLSQLFSIAVFGTPAYGNDDGARPWHARSN